MQSMMTDVRVMWRWTRTEPEGDEYGQAVAEYVRDRCYQVSVRQTAHSLTDQEFGTVRRVGYHLYVNNGHPFVEGDYIGSYDEPKWIVRYVRDHFTGQILDVEQL